MGGQQGERAHSAGWVGALQATGPVSHRVIRVLGAAPLNTQVGCLPSTNNWCNFFPFSPAIQTGKGHHFRLTFHLTIYALVSSIPSSTPPTSTLRSTHLNHAHCQNPPHSPKGLVIDACISSLCSATSSATRITIPTCWPPRFQPLSTFVNPHL